MNSDIHLSQRDLESILSDTFDPKKIDGMSKHLDHCQQCQEAITSFAAPADLWQMIRETTSGDSCREPDKGVVETSIDDQLRIELFRRLFDPPLHPENLAQLDHYDVEREIGHGGMGAVFKAFDTELERTVAIKVLVPGLHTSETTRKRFEREARAVAAVSHPNVIPIYSVNLEGAIPYFTMAFVEGRSLRQLVDGQGPLDELEIIRLAKQISAGLEAAHFQKLIHRDIKPSNILVEGGSGRALLTDFGLAENSDNSSLTPAGWTAGTPGCMSPEQVNGQSLDARTDLFSLGGVIYFMATGKLPFGADSRYVAARMICETRHLSVQELNTDISGGLIDIIDRCLAKNPDNRFQTAGHLQQSLTQLLAGPIQADDSNLTGNQVVAVRPGNRKVARAASFWRPAVGLGCTAAALLTGLFAIDESWFDNRQQVDASPGDRSAPPATGSELNPANRRLLPGGSFRHSNWRCLDEPTTRMPSSYENSVWRWPPIQAALIREMESNGVNTSAPFQFKFHSHRGNDILTINGCPVNKDETRRYSDLLREQDIATNHLIFEMKDDRVVISTNIWNHHELVRNVTGLLLKYDLVKDERRRVDLDIYGLATRLNNEPVKGLARIKLNQVLEKHGIMPAPGKRLVLNMGATGNHHMCGYFEASGTFISVWNWNQ